MSGEGLRFAGYAALFDVEDRGGDVIVPGAFAASLTKWAQAGTALPVLWQHDPACRIGSVESIAEDERGLRVIARLAGGVTATKAAAALRARAVEGLSFGYRVASAEPGPPRRLRQLDLVEVSLVTRPMQPRARVHSVER